MRTSPKAAPLAVALFVFLAQAASAQEVDLGTEYTGYARARGARGTTAPSTGRRLLLYLPNRILDLLDLFRVDVGVGMTYGYVVRPSRSLQFGKRVMAPGSLRIGARGRRFPVFVEDTDEGGSGKKYRTKRQVTPQEFGVGLDAFLVGAYCGISFDELADFVAGVFLFDIKKDDLR